MDLQSWEKVLLQWVHTFGFTKTNYNTLEQTDIDAFFAYYVQKAQVEPVPVVEVALQAQPTHHLSPDEPSAGQLSPLQAFLGEIYPEFNGHTDGQGRLAGSEYLYVYSLLLHYKCVKQPSASFHSICKKLPVLTQSCICEFFQQTMNKEMTRENLREAIANVTMDAEIKPCRATSSHSLDSDGSGHSSCLGDDVPDLPFDFNGRTSSPSPRAMPPPATPKTELLEQRTREVRGLQAQLEAERYEKNVLEEQIMENEHLIKSLRKENKVKKLHLAKLKDSDENEEDSFRNYVPNEFDHLKGSLLKEISQKEGIITETRDKLQDLRIENSALQSKIKSSSEQLVVCMDRIRDLEVQQEELAQTLSTKTNQVDSLERDKQELEQCLQVTRDELHNRREVLNASSDLLDLPMSPNTTPENLADSVIDKQLREKEHENLELKEELQKLNKTLTDILQDLGLSASSESEEHSSQLWSTVGAVKEELTRSVRLNEQRDSQLLEKSQLLDISMAECAKLVEQCREHAQELANMNAEYEQKLSNHLASQQALQSQHDSLLQALNQANDESAKVDEHLRQIKVQLAEKEEQMIQLGSEISELRDKNTTLESRTNSLITERNSGVQQLHQEQRRQEYMRNKYVQCRDELMAQSSDMDDTLRRVDEVMAAREELRQQHEALKLVQAKTEKETQELRERLQLQQSAQQSHEQQRADLQQQLLAANERMEAMQQRHLQFVDEIQTDLKSQLQCSRQEVESFLSRITALVSGGEVSVKSEDTCLLSKFEQFESMLASSLHQRSLEVKEHQTTADQLRKHLEESRQLSSRIDKLMRFIQSLEASATKLRVTLDHKDAEIAAGNQKVANLQEQLASDQASSLMLKQLNDTIHNLEQVNEKLIDDNSKLQSLHMDMSTSLVTANGQVERLANELRQCKASLADMNASDTLKAKEQQKLQVQLEEMNAKKSELEQRVEHLSTLKSGCEVRLQELEKHLAETQTLVLRLDKQHKEELEAIRAKLKEAQLKEERLPELEKQLAEKESQVSQLKKQHEEELEVIKSKLKDAQLNEERFKELEKQLAEKESQVLHLKKNHEEEVETIKAKLKDAQLNEERCKELEKQLAEKESQVSHQNKLHQEDVEVIKSKLKDAQLNEERFKELEKQLQEKESQTSQLKKQHEEELEVIKSELKNAQINEERCQELKNQLAEKESLASCLDKKHKEELEIVKSKLKDAECNGERCQELERQLEEKESQVSCLDKHHEEELEIVKSKLKNALFNEERCQEFEKQLAEKESQATLQSKLHEEQLEAIRAKLKDAQCIGERCQELEKQLAEKESQASHQSKLQEEQLTALKAKLRDIQLNEERYQELEKQLAEKKSQVCRLDKQHEELEVIKSKLKEAQLNEERFRELERQLEEKESQTSHLNKQHEEQLEALRAKLRDAQFNVEQQRQAILTDREEINKYRAQLAELGKARDQSGSEIAKLRLLVSQGERDNQEHLKTNRDLQGKELKLAQKVDKLMGENSEELRRLQAQLMDKQAVVAQLNTQLASATELEQARARQQAQAELAHAELEASLQREKALVEQLRAEAEEKSAAAYERIGKLEKLRQSQDHKVRQLSDQLAEAEQMKVRLNLEIGGLNSDIEQRKHQAVEQAQQLSAEQNVIAELECRLKSEVEGRNQVREELEKITAKLAAVQQELNSTRLAHDTQHFELDEKTREIELERAESAERVHRYQRRIDSLEGQLAEVQAASQVQAQTPTDLCTTYSKDECPASASDDELVQLRQEMARSKLDCQILQAKYRETKDEIQRCEQKMKDQRLEMEGKLDKMKTKMRSLYTAEVTRMKEKQERDAASNKAELDALSAQNVKYEEHTRKLSNQIVRLNDKILEQQKQHAIISTKLRHLQMQQPPNGPKASASVPLVTVPASSSATNDDWQPFKRPTAPTSNLTMEDEEGEVFNNTYLTDLKLGRVPDITAEELNYRNSLQPPHLKSTYAAQYDLSSQDEDLKDGPQSLDDSMCALLSSTGTGARKKSIGTHYKRPGPPTPSKHGGRLSFGSSEPPREVLRECSDHNSTSKTPARFKFLTTRFSVGSSGLPRDENSPPKRRLSNMFKRKERQ